RIVRPGGGWGCPGRGARAWGTGGRSGGRDRAWGVAEGPRHAGAAGEGDWLVAGRGRGRERPPRTNTWPPAGRSRREPRRGVHPYRHTCAPRGLLIADNTPQALWQRA